MEFYVEHKIFFILRLQIVLKDKREPKEAFWSKILDRALLASISEE